MGKLNKKLERNPKKKSSIPAKQSTNKVIVHQKIIPENDKNNLNLIKSKNPENKINKNDVEGKILLKKTIAPKKLKNKREKQKLRRKNLMNKFELIKKERKEEMAKKKREQTKIVGDLKPLKDALPSLNELFSINKEDLKSGIKLDETKINDKKLKLNKKNKIKKQNEELMNRYKCFSSMMTDENYRKNAREIIASHVQLLKKNC